jgi:hypothetical protein
VPISHCPMPLSKLHVCGAERAARNNHICCSCANVPKTTVPAPCCLLQVVQEHNLNFLQRQHAGLRTLLLDFMTLDTVECQQVGRFSAGCNRQMPMHGLHASRHGRPVECSLIVQDAHQHLGSQKRGSVVCRVSHI